MIKKYDSRVIGLEWKKAMWRFETGYDRQMGFATWIIHLICRSCSCRSGWPQFIADTHLLFDRYFFPQEHKGSRSHTDGARGIPLPLVFFFPRLAGWSSPCAHQDQLLVFRQLFGVFDVTRFISRLRF